MVDGQENPNGTGGNARRAQCLSLLHAAEFTRIRGDTGAAVPKQSLAPQQMQSAGNGSLALWGFKKCSYANTLDADLAYGNLNAYTT